jgi:hypothetical protein
MTMGQSTAIADFSELPDVICGARPEGAALHECALRPGHDGNCRCHCGAWFTIEPVVRWPLGVVSAELLRAERSRQAGKVTEALVAGVTDVSTADPVLPSAPQHRHSCSLPDPDHTGMCVCECGAVYNDRQIPNEEPVDTNAGIEDDGVAF